MAHEVYRVVSTRHGKTTWSFFSSKKQALDKAQSDSAVAEVKVNGVWSLLTTSD